MSKERGLICTGESVRAILDNRKHQTRRVIKPQPTAILTHESQGIWRNTMVMPGRRFKCPYSVGDRLYVRETWWDLGHIEKGKWWGRNESHTVKPRYVATCPNPFAEGIGGVVQPVRCHWKQTSLFKSTWRKRPAIFMPKWVARIWRKITGIRAERVQEISAEDCLTEGIWRGDSRTSDVTLRQRFRTLWDSLNAKPKRTKHNPYTNAREDCYVGYPWEDIRKERKLKSGLIEYIVGNPFVFPIEFKRGGGRNDDCE